MDWILTVLILLMFLVCLFGCLFIVAIMIYCIRERLKEMEDKND